MFFLTSIDFYGLVPKLQGRFYSARLNQVINENNM
jgi:hypothetical protein